MTRTANVFARVEPEIKEQAEQVLGQLGIPMSNAVSMFLRQVIIKRGIPFEMTLSNHVPLSFRSLDKGQFDKEMGNGLSDIETGKISLADAVEAEMKRDYGV